MTRVGRETASAYTSAQLLHKPHLEPSGGWESKITYEKRTFPLFCSNAIFIGFKAEEKCANKGASAYFVRQSLWLRIEITLNENRRLPVFYIKHCKKRKGRHKVLPYFIELDLPLYNSVILVSPVIAPTRDKSGYRNGECVHVGVLCTVEQQSPLRKAFNKKREFRFRKIPYLIILGCQSSKVNIFCFSVLCLLLRHCQIICVGS